MCYMARQYSFGELSTMNLIRLWTCCAALCSVSILGCSGSTEGDDVLPETSAFLGTWGVSGSASINCDGETGSASSSTPVDNYHVVFAVGIDSDLVSQDTAGCSMKWSVSGKSATFKGMQPCTLKGRTITLETGAIKLAVIDEDHLSVSADVAGAISDCGTVTASGVGTLIRAKN